MKMMSSTSITSTSGTTLISARLVETRRRRPRRPAPVSAAGCTLGILKARLRVRLTASAKAKPHKGPLKLDTTYGSAPLTTAAHRLRQATTAKAAYHPRVNDPTFQREYVINPTLADPYGSGKVSLRDVQKFHRE